MAAGAIAARGIFERVGGRGLRLTTAPLVRPDTRRTCCRTDRTLATARTPRARGPRPRAPLPDRRARRRRTRARTHADRDSRATRVITSAGDALAISYGDRSGMRACALARSTRPSHVRPPVGPLSTLSSPSSSDSKKCAVNGGRACRYFSDGTARRPGARPERPPVLHRVVIGRTERVCRVVARGARQAARRGERPIGEEVAAERCQEARPLKRRGAGEPRPRPVRVVGPRPAGAAMNTASAAATTAPVRNTPAGEPITRHDSRGRAAIESCQWRE